MTDFPDAPRVALDPEGTVADGLEIAALRDQVEQLTRERDEARAEVARLRGAVELKHAALERLAAIHEAEYDSELRYSRPAWLTAALSPAPEGEGVDASAEHSATLRILLLELFAAEAEASSDCDGIYPAVMDVIEKAIQALRDPTHPCAMCGGVEWRIRDTPGGDFDEVFERCDHQPVEEEPCRRCDGSGYEVDLYPDGSADREPCGTCNTPEKAREP